MTGEQAPAEVDTWTVGFKGLKPALVTNHDARFLGASISAGQKFEEDRIIEFMRRQVESHSELDEMPTTKKGKKLEALRAHALTGYGTVVVPDFDSKGGASKELFRK